MMLATSYTVFYIGPLQECQYRRDFILGRIVLPENKGGRHSAFGAPGPSDRQAWAQL